MMKNLLFLFGSLLVLGAQAQEYVPLINENNTWKTQVVGWGTSYSTYFFQGDTIMEGMTYTRIMGEHEGIEGTWIMGYLREDIAAQKIYTRATTGPEYLMYDFSLEDGDEVTIYPMGVPMTATVESVSTIMVGGTPRKAIHFNFDWYTDIWIVGVGSSLGILNPFSNFPDFDPALMCFYEGNNLAWDNPAVPETCDLMLGIEQATQLNTISIGPNPASDHLQVHLGQYSPGKKIEVRMYSLTGDKIAEEQFLSRSMLTMPLPSVPDGIYLVRISDGDSNVITRKVLVEQ